MRLLYYILSNYHIHVRHTGALYRRWKINTYIFTWLKTYRSTGQIFPREVQLVDRRRHGNDKLDGVFVYDALPHVEQFRLQS